MDKKKVELKVEELEERIAPAVLHIFPPSGPVVEEAHGVDDSAFVANVADPILVTGVSGS